MERKNEMVKFVEEKRMLDEAIAKKKQVIADLYSDLEAFAKHKEIPEGLNEKYQLVVNSEPIKKIVAENELEREGNSKDFMEFQARQAAKKVRKLAPSTPTFNPHSTIESILELDKEVQRLTSANISTRDLIREVAVS
jgi:hypothetical protein